MTARTLLRTAARDARRGRRDCLPEGPLSIIGAAAKTRSLPQPAAAISRGARSRAIFRSLRISPPLAVAATPDAMRHCRPLYLRASDAKPPQAKAPAALSHQVRDCGAESSGYLRHFMPTVSTAPWTAAEFAQAYWPCPEPSASLRDESDEPVGFVLLRSAADEAEIITIGTRPFARRRGIGQRAHRCSARSFCGNAASTRLLIEVAASNAPALALYRQVGFAAAGSAARLLRACRRAARGCHRHAQGAVAHEQVAAGASFSPASHCSHCR